MTQVRQYQGDDTAGSYQDTTMTYDSYGRLKTKHVPEQNTGAVTTYNYNSDDTVSSTVDGRGASCAYAYNNRHQVNSIAHTLSGSSPINIGYAYDASGNRTSISHSVNNVAQDSASYVYDQLSRLTAETRHIDALAGYPSSGNYTIQYSYNLAGALASITDPFGSEIDYGHDVIGRLTSVTSPSGNAYAGVTSYASNVLYRAWGAVKSASFGDNRSETMQYNARLQPIQFRLLNAGSPEKRDDYDYFADGRLKKITDLDDGPIEYSAGRHMSLSYTYDHLGRTLFAGGIPHDSTFNQYYGYDAFDNLNYRSGSYNYQLSQTDTATFSNNKRSGWTYDADGRVTISPSNSSSSGRTWTYDAAGQLTVVAETTETTTTTMITGFDGDGKVLSESANGSLAASDYLVRSAALGGAVITRLDATGNKSFTYVPGGGLLFARQTTSSGQQSMQWSHLDASGVTEGMTVSDPLGHLIGHVQPPQSQQPPNPIGGPGWGVLNGAFSNANNYSTGCMAASGSASDCSGTMREQMSSGLNLNMPGVYADMAMGQISYQFNMNNSIYGGGAATSGQSADSYSVFFGDINTSSVTIFGGLDSLETAGFDLQDLGDGEDIPPRNLLANIFHLLDDNRCSTFVSNLINAARQLTGKKPFTYDGKELALAIARQPDGGFLINPGAQGGGSAYGDIFSGEATVQLGGFTTAFQGLNLRGVQVSYALTALHEMLHLAGGGASARDGSRGYYMDVVLARAAQVLTDAPGYPAGYDPKMPFWQITSDMTKAAGNYWDKQLREHCTPQEYR